MNARRHERRHLAAMVCGWLWAAASCSDVPGSRQLSDASPGGSAAATTTPRDRSPSDALDASGGASAFDEAAEAGAREAGHASNEGSDDGGDGAIGVDAAAATVGWSTRRLLTVQVAEGADVGDINGDGRLDLVAGPVWFDGAKGFAKGGQLIPTLPSLSMRQYSQFFLTFVDDVNGDGRADVIAVGDAGGANASGNPNAFWYENPGVNDLSSNAWKKHTLIQGLVANESPLYLNLVGDAKKELVFIWCKTDASNGSCGDGQLGFARPTQNPSQPWTFTPIGGSYSSAWVHGLGAGDVDNDGKTDVLERSGWWRQLDENRWERHAFEFWSGSTAGWPGNWGGAQMVVADVDGDSQNDVISALAAHHWGLAWFEHQGPAIATGFEPHEILPSHAASENISQLHALVQADINGDGLPDIVTGKRYYAHDNDPGVSDPPMLVWFEMRRAAGVTMYVRHDVHSESGVGCNFSVRDVNGDGKPDIFTSSKRGAFLHVQQ